MASLQRLGSSKPNPAVCIPIPVRRAGVILLRRRISHRVGEETAAATAAFSIGRPLSMIERFASILRDILREPPFPLAPTPLAATVGHGFHDCGGRGRLGLLSLGGSSVA